MATFSYVEKHTPCWQSEKILHDNKYFCEGATVETHWIQHPGSSLDTCYCIVFLGKTLYCHSTSLSVQVYKWVQANLMLG